MASIDPHSHRRGGRAVECAGLENQSPCKRTAGSNPAPSADFWPDGYGVDIGAHSGLAGPLNTTAALPGWVAVTDHVVHRSTAVGNVAVNAP